MTASARPTMIATLTAKPGQTEALRAALLRLVENSRSEEGMVQYDLHQSVERPDQFVFYEIWADERTFAMHRDSAFMIGHRQRVESCLESVVRVPLVRLSD